MTLGKIVITTIAVPLISGLASVALEFDYLNEGRITAETVLEIKNGSVVYNVNETRGAEGSVRIPFRFFSDGFLILVFHISLLIYHTFLEVYYNPDVFWSILQLNFVQCSLYVQR